MELVYSLEQSDYLNYHLYRASTNERIAKKRHRSRLIVPIIYLALGVILFLLNNPFLSSAFIVVALAWYFFHPMYSKEKYFKNYKSFSAENSAAMVGKKVSVKLTTDSLMAQDYTGESKLNLGQIDGIVEIGANYFILLKTNHSVILPKMNQGENLKNIKAFVEQLSAQLELPIIDRLDWVWE